MWNSLSAALLNFNIKLVLPPRALRLAAVSQRPAGGQEKEKSLWQGRGIYQVF